MKKINFVASILFLIMSSSVNASLNSESLIQPLLLNSMRQKNYSKDIKQQEKEATLQELDAELTHAYEQGDERTKEAIQQVVSARKSCFSNMPHFTGSARKILETKPEKLVQKLDVIKATKSESLTKYVFAEVACFAANDPKRVELLRTIAAHNPDLNHQTLEGELPLVQAANSYDLKTGHCQERVQACALLLEKGAHLTVHDKKGDLSFHAAVLNRDVMRVLLEAAKKRDQLHLINAVDQSGCTPLLRTFSCPSKKSNSQALDWKDEEMPFMLLQAGSDTTIAYRDPIQGNYIDNMERACGKIDVSDQERRQHDYTVTFDFDHLKETNGRHKRAHERYMLEKQNVH